MREDQIYSLRVILLLSVIGWGLAGITLPAGRPTRAGAEAGQSAPTSATNRPVNAGLVRLESQRRNIINPFLRTYCAGCHGGRAAAAGLNLQEIQTVDEVIEDHRRWVRIGERLTSHEMPPQDSAQPTTVERQQVAAWIEAVRSYEIDRHRGDPGPVTARRLSNAEYDFTIRDLTGVDLRPAREFPLDPTNLSGFDNSSESLTLGAPLLSRYLDAARRVADHLVLTSRGLTFAPHPMLVESDLDKYAIQRILDFYDRQPTDLADYFEAAWRYRNRPGGSIARSASAAKLSPRYLELIWQTLEKSPEEVGPLHRLQQMWRALPPPSRDNRAEVHQRCVEMRNFVVDLRRHTEKLFPTLESPGFETNFQPIVMYRNSLLAAHRRDFDPTALRVAGEAAPPPLVVTQGPMFLERPERQQLSEAIAAYLKERRDDPDLAVPAGERARYEAAFKRFSHVFPTAFYLRERGRFYPITSMDRERYLGAGLHNRMGYFRDDAPLGELILDEQGRAELESIWFEFEFIANFTLRNFQQFVDQAASLQLLDRTIHKGQVNERVIEAVRNHYLGRTTPQTDQRIIEAINQYFDNVSRSLRRVEQARQEAEPRHLQALVDFAARAWRRPLSTAEREEIRDDYRDYRQQNHLTHEEAIRATLAGLLVSPSFLYHIDVRSIPSRPTRPLDSLAEPLSNHALANRLSYFLWSSMPDRELLELAAAGELSRPSVLLRQARRLQRDDRVRGLAIQFGGHWLDFRRFEDHHGVDRTRFPEFTNQLREAMFEEPIRFLTDLLQLDRPATELIRGRHTFVNGLLAKHYGMPAPERPGEWSRIDDATAYGRGGLLPMAVFLTRNSPGLRTSPVKRGYWVARQVLGDEIPPPPTGVPELPADESKSNLTVRELLVKHRANRSCAACHARFDSFGLAFEEYDPVGRLRTRDLAGRPVDALAPYPDGLSRSGSRGLRDYISARREKDFLRHLTAKMLAYALGRGLRLSDDPLLAKLEQRFAASGYRISTLIETIVTSPQFTHRRRPAAPLAARNEKESTNEPDR